MTPAVSLIAAVARNGAIGRDNALLWHDPRDLAHFRALTMGSPVLMGRRTWDSLPARFRPLPGRRNLVLSRQAGRLLPGAEVHAGLASALAALDGADRVWVIGGAQLYAQALPLADELALTEVDAELDGDTFFPAWDRQAFDEIARERQPGRGEPDFAFVRYRRRRA
ncbi:MAG: dihydrofolate reductase [Rubrivivax sp.]|nr:dihydrofolate reductase [Rubrivivax sp.]